MINRQSIIVLSISRVAGGLGRKHFILIDLLLFFSNCGNSNLNGHYYTTGYYKGMSDGIFWNSGTAEFYMILVNNLT